MATDNDVLDRHMPITRAVSSQHRQGLPRLVQSPTRVALNLLLLVSTARTSRLARADSFVARAQTKQDTMDFSDYL